MRNRSLLLQFPETWETKTGLSVKRSLALFCLLSILFLLGVYTEQIYLAFDQAYLMLFSKLGIASLLHSSQAEVSTQITMRSWPTMVTYGLLYTSLGFLILHVYLNDFRKTRMAATFYLALFTGCILLIALGKLIPDFKWAYMLCRRLIEMVVSPFPVFLLIAVLKGYNRKK